jgi:Mg2+ and Co2+ transporter CorA
MVRKLEAQNGVTWQDFDEPSTDELARLVREAELQSMDAEFVVQNHQRPEVMPRKNYILILIQVPVFDKQARLTLGVPLYCLVGKEKLWTVHFESIPVLESLLNEYEKVAEKREEYFSDGSLALGLHVISNMYASAFHKLERLAKHIDIAEDAVFHGNERKMVEESAVLQRDVLDFRKIVRPQTHLFKVVPRELELDVQTSTQWKRLHHQAQKLWEMLEGLYESASELTVTNTNLLQHKENELLRLLTYYSTLGLPLFVLLEVVKPSNVGATVTDKWIFWIVLTMLIISLGIILARLKKKRVL